MIEKNYIILAFNNPSQLIRLIQRLDDGFSCFYVHIDKKIDLELFSNLSINNKVFIIEQRISCIWGDFTLVQATINCIRRIIEDKRNYYTILLSGQCYPISNSTVINDYIKNNIDFDHIDLVPADNAWSNYKDKINKYKINLGTTKGDYLILPSIRETDLITNLKNLKKIFRLSFQRKNSSLFFKFLKTFRKRCSPIKNHYGGSQWWAFKFETLFKIYEFIENNNKFVDFHKDTHIPDELFFHTIVNYLSQYDNSIKVKKSLTYINWTRNYGKFPVVFNQSDFDEIHLQLEKNKLFARKFDVSDCGLILDLLDKSS